MPIHIKGAGGADKSKGLTATKYDIRNGRTALVNGEMVNGTADIAVFCSPLYDTEGTTNASHSITFEDETLTGSINRIIFRRESFDPDDGNELDHRIVKEPTIHTFQTWHSIDFGTTGNVVATVEYFANGTERLYIDVVDIAYDYTTPGVLTLTLSKFYFEGEWLHADVILS